MGNKYLKKYIQKSAALLGVGYIAKRLRKGAAVLFYHGVEKTIIDTAVQETHIQLDEFEKQMLYLKKNYEIISLDYLDECISQGYKIYPSQIVLTFDDGYKNNFYNVAPLLGMLNMPFTIFISTRFINSVDDVRLPYYYIRTAICYAGQKYIEIPSIKRKYDISTQQKRISVLNTVLEIIKTVPQKPVSQIINDVIKILPGERWLELNSLFCSDELMNWDEVKKLHDSGVTIGSHCHDHVILHSGQSDDEIDGQLKNSKDLIEKYLGECRYFTYPNGRIKDISRYALLSVKKNKYHLGFTTVPGEVENRVNPFIIPRLFPNNDMVSFKYILNTAFRHNRSYNKWCSTF